MGLWACIANVATTALGFLVVVIEHTSARVNLWKTFIWARIWAPHRKLLVSAERSWRSCIVTVLAGLVCMTPEGYGLFLVQVYFRSWLKVVVRDVVIILLVTVLTSKVRYKITTILLKAKILVNATAVYVVLGKCIKVWLWMLDLRDLKELTADVERGLICWGRDIRAHVGRIKNRWSCLEHSYFITLRWGNNWLRWGEWVWGRAHALGQLR